MLRDLRSHDAILILDVHEFARALRDYLDIDEIKTRLASVEAGLARDGVLLLPILLLPEGFFRVAVTPRPPLE